MIHCPDCNMPIDEDGAFCGHCGGQLRKRPHAPVYARVPPVAQKNGHVEPVVQWQHITMGELPVPRPLSPTVARSPFAMRVASKTPVPMGNKPTPIPFLIPSAPSAPSATVSSQILEPVGGSGRNIVFLSIILTILLVGVLAGALTLFQHKSIPSRYTDSSALSDLRGNASFSDGQGEPGKTSNLNISINGLDPLTSGSHYAAWILDEQTEHVSSLGILTQKGSVYTLNFQRNSVNVLNMGNKLEITRETTQTTLPTGHVILSARLPMEALVHIKHLLVAFPGTPGNIALLTGLRAQSKQLYDQTQLLKSGNDADTTRCVAQNVVNLIEGKHGAQAQPLEPICATKHVAQVDDGYGLLGNNSNGYVANVAMHASLAATQPDTTDTIRVYAQRVIYATDTINVWLKGVDLDAQSLLVNPNDTSKIQDMDLLSERAFNGVDLDHDGHVDSIRGEAGVMNAYLDGQAMANLTLLPTSN